MPLRTIIIKATRSGTASTVIIRRGASGTGGGDHGALTGLEDDDHTQYLNNTRGDARYSKLTGATFTGSVAFTSGNLTMLDETDTTSIQLKSALGSVSSFSVYTGNLYATNDITIPNPNDTGFVTYPPVIRMEAETGSIVAKSLTLTTTPLPITSGGTGANNLDALQPKITSANASTTRTALGSKAIGDALFQSETEANALEVLGKRLKIKSASTTRTSAGTGSTYTVDSDFTIAVVAGGVYTVQFVFYHTCTANSGFKGRFKIPSVPTVLVAAHYGAGFLTQTGGSTTYVDQQTTGYIGAEKINRTTAVIAGSIGGQFEVQIGTSGGDLTFEWAQNASHADASTLLIGSRIIVTRHY